MSNKFDSGINKAHAQDLLIGALGANAMEKLSQEFGDDGRNTIIENIAMAFQYYPMFRQIAKIKDKQELATLLSTAAQKQSEIKQKYFNRTALTELGDKLYNGTYEFVLQQPELKQIFENWKTALPDNKKKLCSAIVKNISQMFGVPEPKLLFQTSRTLPVNGVSLPDAIVINLSQDNGIIALITHEFTHHLQHHGKTPGANGVEQSREYYIFSSMLPGNLFAEYKSFIDNNIYRDSLIETEAKFTGQYVKDMYRRHHMSDMQNITPDKSHD